ncbi:MAG: dihydrodipicolinate synthase family protein [Armatimonadota bacterium]
MRIRLPHKKMPRFPGGVWSAAPTPFNLMMDIDADAVHRMIDHHIRLGVSGLFLAGTNGEGPWMPEHDKQFLVRLVVECVDKRMPIAVQVTDNSAARILENIYIAKEDGADIAVIAPPFFLLNGTPRNVADLYLDAIRRSPLPIGIYDRGNAGSVVVPDEVLKSIYAEPNVVMIKDSSMQPARREIALAAKKKRPNLTLLNGWEFNCVDYLRAGYDGLLLGGGVFNGYLARMILHAVQAGDLPLAHKQQRRMNRIMYAVYGGKKIACWLAGEKKLLMEMGIFHSWRNYLNYPLTTACCKAIERVLANDADVLLPAEGPVHGETVDNPLCCG